MTATAEPHSPLPPEEKFWQRYSPHHEAPVSGVTSTVLHAIALALLLLIFWVSSIVKFEDDPSPLPISVAQLAPGVGGGKGKGPGELGDDNKVGERGDDDRRAGILPPGKLPPLSAPKADSVVREFGGDESIQKWTRFPNSAFLPYTNQGDEIRSALREATRGGGRGGSGGGDGVGVGPRTGPGDKLTPEHERIKRALRWNITFNTSSGIDYKNQLAGLGAFVAIPIDGKPDRFHLIRDLNDQKAAREESIAGLDRIFWIDDKPASVASLLSVLPGVPRSSEFFAFLPQSLEKKLYELEMDYLTRRLGRSDENDIHETHFEVVRSGSRYDVRVRVVYLRR